MESRIRGEGLKLLDVWAPERRESKVDMWACGTKRD